MAKKRWQRGTCARCGKPGFLYEGTDVTWVHDHLERPYHHFVIEGTPFTPDENQIADERHDERFTPDLEPPEDDVAYGQGRQWDRVTW